MPCLAAPSSTVAAAHRLAHDPVAEAAWVADHDHIARAVARRRARGKRDRIEDYEQVGRLALVEAYRRRASGMGDMGDDGADLEAYAQAVVQRRTSRLWMTYETIRPTYRFGGRADRHGRAEPIRVEFCGGDYRGVGVEVVDEGRDAVGKIEDEDTVEYAVKGLTDNEKDIVICYFDLDSHGPLTVARLARRGNTSESTVRDVIRRAIDKMRRTVEREERG